MWNIGEYWGNTEDNDVTKLKDWLLSNPKIDDQDFFIRLRQMVEISSVLMSMADVIEMNLLQDEPESVIFGIYFFIRKFSEAKGELANKGDVTKFNKKIFTLLFNSLEKMPLFQKKYKAIYRARGNDNINKYQWQKETENKIRDKYSKMIKKLQVRNDTVAPEIYSEVIEIIQRVFQVSQGIKIDAK